MLLLCLLYASIEQITVDDMNFINGKEIFCEQLTVYSQSTTAIFRCKLTLTDQPNSRPIYVIKKLVKRDYNTAGMNNEELRIKNSLFEENKVFAINEITNMKEASTHFSEHVVNYYGGKAKGLVIAFNNKILGYLAEHVIYMEHCFGDAYTMLNNLDRIHVIKHIVEAIYLLHSKGIAHRDIKLDNIFVCGTSNDIKYKIGDFEFSTTEELSDDSVYTEGYAAPELHKETKYVNKRRRTIEQYDTKKVDIYALGVTFMLIFKKN